MENTKTYSVTIKDKNAMLITAWTKEQARGIVIDLFYDEDIVILNAEEVKFTKPTPKWRYS